MTTGIYNAYCLKITSDTRGAEANNVPTAAEMVMTDASGRDYELRGEVVAANRIPVWPNMDTWICLARWECEGHIRYGDLQQVQWHDYVRQFLGR